MIKTGINNLLFGDWSCFTNYTSSLASIEVKPKSDNPIDTIEMNQNVQKQPRERVVFLPTEECEIDNCIIVADRCLNEYLARAVWQKKVSLSCIVACSIGTVAMLGLSSIKWIGLISSIGAILGSWRYQAALIHEEFANHRIDCMTRDVAEERQRLYDSTNANIERSKRFLCPSELKVIAEPHVPCKDRVIKWLEDVLQQEVCHAPAERNKWVKEVFFDNPFPLLTYRDSKEDQKCFAKVNKKYKEFRKFVGEPKHLQVYRAALLEWKEQFLDKLFKLIPNVAEVQSRYVRLQILKSERVAIADFRKFMFVALKDSCPLCWCNYYGKLVHDLKYAQEEYAIHYTHAQDFLKEVSELVRGIGSPSFSLKGVMKMSELPVAPEGTGIALDESFYLNARHGALQFSGDEQKAYEAFAKDILPAALRAAKE